MSMHWLKHAFAVDRAGPAEPTPQQRPVLEGVCREIVRRNLTTPSLIFLEMSRPLNYLGAQAMHFFSPFISAVTGARSHQHLAQFLEQRGSIDYICGRIEELENSRKTNNTDEHDSTRS